MNHAQTFDRGAGYLADDADPAYRPYGEPIDVPGAVSLPTEASPRLQRLAQFGLCLAAFFGGWNLLRIAEFNLTLSDLALTFVLATMLFQGRVNTRPFGTLSVFWYVGLALMLGGLLASTIAHGSVLRWLIVGAQYLFAFMLLPMILTGQHTSFTRRLPALFVLGITISQLIGVSASLVFDHSDTIDLMGDGFLTGNGRVGAMTGEPNPNGAMVAFALPMLIYSIQKRTIPIGIALICGALLVWGLLASGSFTGFSATVIATSIYLAISGIGYLVRFALVGLVAGGLFVASGLPLPGAFEERVAGALTTGDLNQAGTFTDRADLVAEAWQMTDDNLFLGLGVDQFRVVSSHGAPVHELHLLILNEGGVVAFAGLAILLIMLVVTALVAVSRSRSEGAMILAVVAVFMVYTFSIPHMYSRQWILPVLLAMSSFYALRPSYLPPGRDE